MPLSVNVNGFIIEFCEKVYIPKESCHHPLVITGINVIDDFITEFRNELSLYVESSSSDVAIHS